MYEKKAYTDDELNKIYDDAPSGWEISGYYGTEEIDVEIWDEEALVFRGENGYNVNWCDREGRHPWCDVIVEYSLTKGTYKVVAELGSKDGRIDEKDEESGTFTDITNLYNIIEDAIDQVCVNVEQAAY